MIIASRTGDAASLAHGTGGKGVVIAKESLLAAQHWLLEHVGTKPRRMRDLLAQAEHAGIDARTLKKASRTLPIIRRPETLRGLWVWSLPADDEQVLVRFFCPLRECPAYREGWMKFSRSRSIFFAGVLKYQVRGRIQRRRPPEAEGHLLQFKDPEIEDREIEDPMDPKQ